jgi:hypothetical protein
VYKWKARLNIDGSKHIYGEDYWETYAPVANWASIRLVLIMALVNNWQSRQIDFFQAYTQSNKEKNIYMALPKGFDVSEPGDFVLKVHENVFGQKQAGRVWNQHLVKQLQKVGFTQSQNDPCIFMKGQIIYVLYKDNSILMGTDPDELDSIIRLIKGGKNGSNCGWRYFRFLGSQD